MSNKKIFKKSIIFLIIMLVLTGCSEHTECNNGTITGKLYKEPYVTYILSGKVVIPIHHSEKYLIELNQSCTFEIKKDEFEKLNIGDEIKPKSENEG